MASVIAGLADGLVATIGMTIVMMMFGTVHAVYGVVLGAFLGAGILA